MKLSYLFLAILVFTGISFSQQLLFEENFDYPAGTDLNLYGWSAHSGAGNIPIQVVSPGLVYNNYPPSGIGNAAEIVSGSGSREDVNKAFTAQSGGSIYEGFMVNVTSATPAGEYFIHFSKDTLSTTYFRGKVFVKSDGASNIAFGIAKGNNADTVYTDYLYTTGSTYLIIMEYLFNSGSSDDAVNLWIDPTLTGGPPIPDLTQTDASEDPSNLGTIALRQSGTNGPVLFIDGIRIGTTWETITSGTVTNPPVITNILLEPFPAGQNIDITCDVTIASGTIDSVRLYFYTDFNLNNLDSLPMNPTSGDQYEATIGSQQNGTSLVYWVKAWGNNTSSVSTQNKVIIGIPDIGIFHTQLDADGLPLAAGYLTKLQGIVTVASGVFSTTNYDFYMQDNTGGINVFKFNIGATQYFEGDELEVLGTIDTYNGKVEISNFDATVLSTGNPLPAPIDVNIEDMGEAYEGRLITIDNVSLAAGSDPWPTTQASTNLTITDGTGEMVMRIVDSTHIGGNPEPNWPITVVGIGNQFDTSAPYFEGFQIQPRSYGDLMSTGIDDNPAVVYSYSLGQNYPNPFNPVTIIPYTLQKAGKVNLRVFNILGEEVYSFSQKQSAGKHSITFDGRRFSSGIYFYQLEAANFKSVRKMILTK
jgi:hypothetical protein